MKRLLAALITAVLMTGSLAGCAKPAVGEGKTEGTSAPGTDEGSGRTEGEKIEGSPEDITALASAEELLTQAAKKSLFSTRLSENKNILRRSLLFSESGSVVETLYLAAPDTFTSIKYLDNAIVYFEVLRGSQIYRAGVNADGAMKANVFIYASEEDCRQWIGKNHAAHSLEPVDGETVTGVETIEGLTRVTTEITDPYTVNAMLEDVFSSAFTYRDNSKIVTVYSISEEGYIVSSATDYVLADGTALPYSRTEIETDTDQTFSFPYSELELGIDPDVTRDVTLVFYPGTDDSFTTERTLPQGMAVTPVLPGNTSYDAYTDEACTEKYAGNEGTEDLTLYIVPNAPLPVEIEPAAVDGETEGETAGSAAEGSVDHNDDIRSEEANQFLSLLSQNLMVNRTAGEAALGMRAVYQGADGAELILTAGFSADVHYAVSYKDDVVMNATLFEDSTVTRARLGEGVSCQVYEADSSFHTSLAEAVAALNVTLMNGERLETFTMEDGVLRAVTTLSDRESIEALTTSSVRAHGMDYTYTDGDVFRTSFTFDDDSGELLSLECHLLSADGNDTPFSVITFENGADVAGFAFPYAALSDSVNPEETRTYTMVFDPGEEEHFSISRTIPQYIKIQPIIERDDYGIYADEECTVSYDSNNDDLTSDVTIYIK